MREPTEAEAHAALQRAIYQLPTRRLLADLEMRAPCTWEVLSEDPLVLGEKRLDPIWQAQKDHLLALHAEAVESVKRRILPDSALS